MIIRLMMGTLSMGSGFGMIYIAHHFPYPRSSERISHKRLDSLLNINHP